MLRSLLRSIRNIPFLNQVVRQGLQFTATAVSKLESHWRVSGVVYITFNGLRVPFYTQSDDDIVDTLFYNKHYYEYNDLNLFVQLAGSARKLVDVGANTGLYSVLSAKANPRLAVTAFEPNPTNHSRLRKNIELNQLGNIEVVANAVGNSKQPISFTIPCEDKISYTSSALGEFSRSAANGHHYEWKEITVPQTTLDEYFAGSEGEVDLLKIDVEGYEVNVFEGSKGFFRRHSPVVLCEIFLDADKRRYFQQFLHEFNYTAYIVLRDGLLRLDGGMPANQEGNNFLFSRGYTSQVFTPFHDIERLRQELLLKPVLT